MTHRTMASYTHSRVLLISHYATTAMQDFLTLYLNDRKVKKLTVINFPLPEIPLLRHIEVYEYVSGKKHSSGRMATILRPTSLAYVAHFFQSLWLIFRLSREAYDLVIAQNSMLALASLCMRFFGKVRKVVFYSHGVSQKRFSHSAINSIYQSLDKFVYTHSDANWALSADIGSSRALTLEKPIRVVPATVPTKLFPVGTKKRSIPTIVFIGTLNHMNGADLLPEILHELNKTGTVFHLDIIGIGPEKKNIEEKIRLLALGRYVRLLGYQDIFTYAPTLSKYVCGLAPYRNDDASLLTSTDPMKIQIYAAAGIPTVVTEGYTFSHRIQTKSLGLSVPCSPSSFAKAISSVFMQESLYRRMAKNSRMYAQAHDIYKIYEREFSALL